MYGKRLFARIPGIWCVVAQMPGYLFNMTFSLAIDQEFAIVNNLTLVQVSTLAAFMTLPIWTKTIAIDGKVWYYYTDEKMAEDFPLLFGVSKRCYKNISELANMGFVELTKLGREKYVRFTARCKDWNKEKDRICTESPKTDYKKTENGLNNSPKTDSNYNINNTNIIIPNNADGGLFPVEETTIHPSYRGTTEPQCLFANSRFNRYEAFAECFKQPEFENVDISYYYNAVADWSAAHGKRAKDWIATARGFMRRDKENNKLHLIQKENDFDYESAKRYLEMGMN